MRLLQEKDTNRHPAAEDHCAHQVWKQEWKFVENGVAGKDARIADTRLSQSATQSWAQDGATIVLVRCSYHRKDASLPEAPNERHDRIRPSYSRSACIVNLLSGTVSLRWCSFTVIISATVVCKTPMFLE